MDSEELKAIKNRKKAAYVKDCCKIKEIFLT